VASFTDSLPASALTDNGSVYTSRFTHGHNDFERLLASLAEVARAGYLAGSSHRCCAELSLGAGRLGVGPLAGGPRHR
jgi:hypothetical protein